MGKAPRITNRERVLLALADAPDYESQYEVPRRFSQAGLAQRLDMAQSHVSRALNQMIKEGLLTHQRRRVAGERRRVTAYSLTENGVDEVVDLIHDVERAEVLTTGSDGGLENIALEDLVERWERGGARRVPDALAMAELLRLSTTHDGQPLIEAPPEFVDAGGEADLSSEAIGLHLELADLRRSQGDLPAALDHLSRAADLHRRRGNPAGEVRCLLAAATLGAPVQDASRLVHEVESIRDPEARYECYLMLYDALILRNAEMASSLLENLSEDDPEVLLRKADSDLRAGRVPDLSNLVEELESEDELRRTLWRVNLLRIRCRGAARAICGWPVPLDVEEVLAKISPDSRHPHPLLFGELTLALVGNPVVSDEQRRQLLQSAWDVNPPLPTLGHIGFQLANLMPNPEALVLLQRLQQVFQEIGEEGGAQVCASRIERL